MIKNMNYLTIEQALFDGYKLTVWRSAGGLRVANLKLANGKKAKEFYGESCDLSNALRILSDDVAAGGRKYKDVYGPIEDHYLTGGYPDPNDIADRLVFSGNELEITAKNNPDRIICQASYELWLHTPAEIWNLKLPDDKTHVLWRFNHTIPNVVFKTSKNSTEILTPGFDFHYKHNMIGGGQTVVEAIRDMETEYITQDIFKTGVKILSYE